MLILSPPSHILKTRITIQNKPLNWQKEEKLSERGEELISSSLSSPVQLIHGSFLSTLCTPRFLTLHCKNEKPTPQKKKHYIPSIEFFFNITFKQYFNDVRNRKKTVVEKWKLISMENPICKINLIFLIARCCILGGFWGVGALSLRCCAHAFFSCGEQELLFILSIVGCGLLLSGASFVVEHRLQATWASAVAAPRLQNLGSMVMTHRLSCSATCGILLAQGRYLCPLHQQVTSYPLFYQGSLVFCFVLPSGDPSNRTVRLEPNPKKKQREELADPYKMAAHFLSKTVGSPREDSLLLHVKQCHLSAVGQLYLNSGNLNLISIPEAS